MNDMNEKALQELIDRMLAGEQVDSADVGDADLERLLEMAATLHDEREEPDAGFEAELRERLLDLRDMETAASADETPGERWFPGWVTWRRAAAVAATLVVGLGIAGMTQAVLTGDGPIDDDGSVVMRTDDVDTALDEKTIDQMDAGGRSPGVEATAPELNGEDASVAAGEPMLESTMPEFDLRRVIHTAEYDIEVPVGDFQDRYDDITGIAARYGGYVIFSESSVSDDDDDQLKQGTITIRIANTGDNFNAAQADIEDLGLVVARQVSGEDVTEEFVDLQSRLRNAEAQQASLLALMEQAETIDEILLVQSRLDEVQMEIEQLKGSIEYLETVTDFATISVYMFEEDVEKEDDGEDDGIDWGFVDAIKYAGWLAVQTVNFVIIALGVIIPSALLLALVALVAYRIYRRRRS